MLKQTILAVASGLVLTACVSLPRPETPALTTRVVDAATSEPISTAIISVSSPLLADRPMRLAADGEGHVSLPPMRGLGELYVGPRKARPAYSTLRVEAPGYVPLEVKVEMRKGRVVGVAPLGPTTRLSRTS